MKFEYNFVPFLYETPYLIENLQTMTNNDEAPENESKLNEADHSTVFNSSTSTMANSSTNSGNGSWFRSIIPKRIRKFISKQSRYSSKHLEQTSSELVKSKLNASASTDPDGSADGVDELNLYSIVDHFDRNDEEVAMIRATAQMARFGWFWGPISRHTAQKRLHGTPNGSFLVRNSQINLHNFTISFRTAGKTLHYRIEFVDGYWQTFSSKHRSIVDLIDDAMKKSKENVFCYVKQSSQLIPPFPVRLTNPISHFGDISSLQNLCRLVIQKSVKIDCMDLLPLPNKLISYCKEWETIYGVMPI